jgi:uncharacterized protein (DUF58 family)
VIPTRRLYGLLGGTALVGLVAGLWPGWLPVWGGLVGSIAAAVGLDTWRLYTQSPPELERQLPDSLPVGVWSEVTLSLTHAGDSPLELELFDTPPTATNLEGLPVRASLPPDRRVEATYRVRPNRRGDHAFEPADARMLGPLGLVRRPLEIGEHRDVRILPNYRAVSRYALLALADRTGRLGIRQVRQRGRGMEFSHLREYREGDRTRQIDWKATARMRELISREYEDERNQHVVFLLDCGRRMRARDGDVTHFDRCLNASLLLTHVALEQGDSVGLATFGGRDLWVPRQRGDRGMDVVLDHVYDLEPTSEPSDVTEAARRLTRRRRRRSLIVVLTNLYDQGGEEMRDALSLLGERHMVLLASLREEALHERLEQPVESFDDALEVAATHEYLAPRRRTHRDLEARGVSLLDVPPSQLSVRLVNRYVELKREGEW